jgi:hypothetical protein
MKIGEHLNTKNRSQTMKAPKSMSNTHRTMSPEIKARNIARSIALRVDGWTWTDYGIARNPKIIALVKAALAQL